MIDLKGLSDGNRPLGAIHPTAIVEDGAEIGAGCAIGPFCDGRAGGGAGRAGRAEEPRRRHRLDRDRRGDGRSGPSPCIGEVPQDLKFRGEHTRLVIGKRNRIREGATMNTGTEGGGGVTRVGDDGLFMTGGPCRP